MHLGAGGAGGGGLQPQATSHLLYALITTCIIQTLQYSGVDHLILVLLRIQLA